MINDNSLWDNSEVMSELLKLASKESSPKTEDLTVEEEDMVEEAHPESVYVAEALGDGALVENQNEQHEKMVAVVNKMPNGKLIHTYAACAVELVKLAEECEAAGESETAELLTIMAEKVLDVPFV
jgi:hypothetical protein